MRNKLSAAAKALGKIGGSKKSAKKARSSRENGKKGGATKTRKAGRPKGSKNKPKTAQAA